MQNKAGKLTLLLSCAIKTSAPLSAASAGFSVLSACSRLSSVPALIDFSSDFSMLLLLDFSTTLENLLIELNELASCLSMGVSLSGLLGDLSVVVSVDVRVNAVGGDGATGFFMSSSIAVSVRPRVAVI